MIGFFKTQVPAYAGEGIMRAKCVSILGLAVLGWALLWPQAVLADFSRAADAPLNDFRNHHTAMVRYAEQKDRVEALKTLDRIWPPFGAIDRFLKDAEDALNRGGTPRLVALSRDIVKARQELQNYGDRGIRLGRAMSDGTKTYSSELSDLVGAKIKFENAFGTVEVALRDEGKKMKAEMEALKKACSKCL